jgi:hypothetical protein
MSSPSPGATPVHSAVDDCLLYPVCISPFFFCFIMCIHCLGHFSTLHFTFHLHIHGAQGCRMSQFPLGTGWEPCNGSPRLGALLPDFLSYRACHTRQAGTLPTSPHRGRSNSVSEASPVNTGPTHTNKQLTTMRVVFEYLLYTLG